MSAIRKIVVSAAALFLSLSALLVTTGTGNADTGWNATPACDTGWNCGD
jgi:hypothetical protein